MRAAVTIGPGELRIRDVAEPAAPGPDQVLLRPLTVGVCGSDLHLFDGDTEALSGAGTGVPRVQGHEIGAELLHDPSGRTEAGSRVAVWPLHACGTCHMCRGERPNACVQLSVLGVHTDGGLAERLLAPADHVFPVGDISATAAAFAEPASVALHAVNRSGAAAGDRVVVFGGGAVGQATCMVLAQRGVRAMLFDPVKVRVDAAQVWGSRGCTDTGPAAVRARVTEWSCGVGADAVIDATGVPQVLDTALDVVRVGGTVVAVGLTSESGTLRPGRLPAKEIALLGASCCTAEEFGEATSIVSRWSAEIDRLPVRRFSLERCAEAIPAAATAQEAVKVFVDIDLNRTQE